MSEEKHNCKDEDNAKMTGYLLQDRTDLIRMYFECKKCNSKWYSIYKRVVDE